jgi:hypothetical protein
VDHAHQHEPAPPGVRRLVAAGTLDAELGALVWLLVEGGVPILVCGPAAEPDLTGIAEALTETAPNRDLADRPGPKPATTLRAGSLKEAFQVLSAEPFSLSDDEQRALGLVVVIRDGRAAAVHYVRPVERDGEGHLQRRPPAVLATWDADRDAFEHFSWAMTPELSTRIGMTQAELEDLHRDRAHTLSHAAPAHVH